MRLHHLGWGLALLCACGARSAVEEFTTDPHSNGGAASDGVIAAGGSPRATAAAPVAAVPTAPYGCFAFTGTLLDDIEDRQITKSIGPGLQLTWSATVVVGSQKQIGAVQLTPPRGASRFAMHASTNASSLSLELGLSPCVALGSARGISFWARGNTSLQTRVNLYSLASTPELLGGLCQRNSCSSPGVGIFIATEWQQFQIIFSSLDPVEPPADFQTFTRFELFAGTSSGPVELWVDDLELIR